MVVPDEPRLCRKISHASEKSVDEMERCLASPFAKPNWCVVMVRDDLELINDQMRV
ncbi:MAG: hypothetical protein M3461_23060 [Pseudomonadota bacterium]|nr:hypothetical protein [Pseudomonadota bacterium]